MLRWLLVGYGLLSLAGAIVLFFVLHAPLWLAGYLALNGSILVGGMLLERKRYQTRIDRTRGEWQATGERFVDPASGRLMEVTYNRATGERDYRELSSE